MAIPIERLIKEPSLLEKTLPPKTIPHTPDCHDGQIDPMCPCQDGHYEQLGEEIEKHPIGPGRLRGRVCGEL